MKIKILLMAMIILGLGVSAQIAPDKYYVQFTDKNDSPYSLNEPSEYLTQRALDRREKQNIKIDMYDIPVNPQYLTGVKNKGVTLLNATRWLNGVTIETDDPSLLDLVNSLPYVEEIFKMPNNPSLNKKAFFENEIIQQVFTPDYSLKWNTTSTYDYGKAEWQIEQIHGIGLHDAGYDGKGIVIAVLDGGFNGVLEHPVFDSIRSNGQILGTKDYVNGGDNVYTGSAHGKSVLSTIAANSPGVMVGTAPKASFWLLRTEDTDSENVIEEYNWISAAEYADSLGADVINSSLSYVGFDIPEWDHTYEDLDGNTAVSTIGADMATSKGIFVCNSAGNSGGGDFPWNGAPADADSVFSIGAVDSTGNKAGFSSIGPTTDGRIKPAVVALGAGTYVAYGIDVVGKGNGTSYSSPIIAGMTACLIQANPTIPVMQIQKAIKQSGTQRFNPDNLIGWGIPNYELANSVMTTLENQMATHEDLFRLWPNPLTNGNLNIEFAKDLKGEIKLVMMNATGSVLFAKEINLSSTSQKVELSGQIRHLASGVYFLKIIAGDRVEVKQIVKN